MFNILGKDVYGRRVLDLFAGTGSLGLEAASRGASDVVLVDHFKETYDLLVENIQTLGFNKECQALFMDWQKALGQLARTGRPFDLVFIDPPYLNEMIPPAMAYLEAHHLISSKGIIVTKIDTSEEVFQGTAAFPLSDVRNYGNTTLVFYRARQEDE